jgi:hypothetical protein
MRHEEANLIFGREAKNEKIGKHPQMVIYWSFGHLIPSFLRPSLPLSKGCASAFAFLIPSSPLGHPQIFPPIESFGLAFPLLFSLRPSQTKKIESGQRQKAAEKGIC